MHVYPSEEGLAVYFQDITDRKRTEARLLLFESIVVNAYDGVVILEPELEEGRRSRRILYANDAFCRMTGYGKEELLESESLMLMGPETDWAAIERMREALRREEPFRDELLIYRKDGSTFWTESTLVRSRRPTRASRPSWRASPTPSSPWTGSGASPSSTAARPR